MKLPGPRAEPQPTLWPEPDFSIHSVAQCRNLCGDFFEQALARVTGGRLLKTDSTCDVCPDCLSPSGAYHEDKSVGRQGAAIIYKVRFDREVRLVATGRRLYYWLWHHGADAVGATSKFGLDRALAEGLRYLLVLPFEDVAAEVLGLSLKTLCSKLNKTNYARNGYGDGWSIPLKRLVTRSTEMTSLPGHLLGYPVPSFPVFYKGDPEDLFREGYA